MTIWKLLKDYVHEFEIANAVEFSDGSWQRIKRLEKDILAVQYEENREMAEAYQNAMKQQAIGYEAAIQEILAKVQHG